MGGCCCCCSSQGTELNDTPAYNYYSRASAEHVPLSSCHGATSTPSSGLLVDTNLEISIPSTYTSPPAPLQYDAALRDVQTPTGIQESCRNNGGNAQETSAKCEDLKESKYDLQNDDELDSKKYKDIELSKSIEPLVSETEEDVCPICLEEYDAENPRTTTKCEHHFHLACILDWMERSDTCPVCEQETILNSPID